MATKRPTASDEVARSRLVSPDGFPFAFRAKNGEWRDLHLGFQVSFDSTLCVYRRQRRSKFVHFVRTLTSSGGRKKQKFVSISSQCWERRFHNQGILDIRTHFKPTETFQYTHFSSCIHHGVRKGLIKGEALRLLGTNSSAKSFYENIYNFKKRLRARADDDRIVSWR